MRFLTRSVHVGQEASGEHRPVIEPIYQTATFGWDEVTEKPRYDYTRSGNPNRTTLEQVLASLENAKHCHVFGSGMAAIGGGLSLLKHGDHVLVAKGIYGATQGVAEQILPRQGIEAGQFDASNPDEIRQKRKPNTKMVVFESPTNPTLRLADIPAIAKVAKAEGLLTLFDNTFASPYLQNPLDMGVDVVAHSTTKYLGGHSDLIGGALMTNSDEHAEWFAKWENLAGSIPGPFDCWLTLRGVKTLGLRMRQHCANAQAVAEFLHAHPRIKKVNYPGLPSHPEHELAKRQMRGFGGMLSFVIDGTVDDLVRFTKRTKVFQVAPSLGGVESLFGYPTKMSHVLLTEEQRQAMDIPPTLLRVSVGIEDTEDLVDDLRQALA